jgi:hypothetical protein
MSEVRIIKTTGPPPKKGKGATGVHTPTAAPAPPPPVIKKTAKHRTYPKSSLKTRRAKIVPSSNPTKSPPVRKEMLRMMTTAGLRRKTRGVTQRVSRMSDAERRKLLAKSGHPVSKKAPPELVADILAGGMEAGMIPVE